MQYEDIGHKHKDDVLWILIDYSMSFVTVGSGRTHEMMWGEDIEIDNCCWRGRYEPSTGFCSIVPPKSQSYRRRPPQEILMLLQWRFSVVKFHFFADSYDSFEPNQKKNKGE